MQRLPPLTWDNRSFLQYGEAQYPYVTIVCLTVWFSLYPTFYALRGFFCTWNPVVHGVLNEENVVLVELEEVGLVGVRHPVKHGPHVVTVSWSRQYTIIQPFFNPNEKCRIPCEILVFPHP